MAIGKKTGGRKKGVQNKRTREELDRATRVLTIIEDEFLEDDIRELTPAQRTTLYANIMEFKVPKLSRTEVLADIKTDIHWNETKKYGTGTKAESGT